mgnify:FL=1
MNILIYGVGGIGGFLGSKLIDESTNLTFMARGKRYDFLKKNGLFLKSSLGNSSVKKIHVINKIDPDSRFDYIFSTVKLYDFDNSLEEILSLKNKDFIFIPFQNGIYAEKKAISVLGKEKVCAGVAQISSYIDKKQTVIHIGKLATFFIGTTYKYNQVKLQKLCSHNCINKIDLIYKSNIYEKIWQKFIFLSAYSGMTTAYNKTIGQLFDDTFLKSQFIDAMQETFNLATFYNIQFKQDPIKFWLKKIENMPYEMTSSMHEDYKRNKKLELQWLSGSVVDKSKDVGINCKIHKTIVGMIKN